MDNVYGTTNDFDNTSWCTTSGSCQKTNSQIPKSCCKNENEFDYETAHSNCHASVNPGTYHEKVRKPGKATFDSAVYFYGGYLHHCPHNSNYLFHLLFLFTNQMVR